MLSYGNRPGRNGADPRGRAAGRGAAQGHSEARKYDPATQPHAAVTGETSDTGLLTRRSGGRETFKVRNVVQSHFALSFNEIGNFKLSI